jgi:hypothetical protein
MSESFHGQAGTNTQDSIDLTLEKETFVELAGRYKWATRWLTLQLFLLAGTMTVPYLWPNGKEMAGVVFGVGLTMTVFVAITGLVVGTVNLVRRLFSSVRNSDTVAS